jgi:ferredoxin
VFAADEYGYSVVKTPEVGLDLEEKVRRAERNCPEQAITTAPVV